MSGGEPRRPRPPPAPIADRRAWAITHRIVRRNPPLTCEDTPAHARAAARPEAGPPLPLPP
ncbi:hypothetical protein FTX61_04655 [Nitriliruptoraceae bacterium ZYF776]|nr:hypothetical protein [Profundirhabdus halotolerans]